MNESNRRSSACTPACNSACYIEEDPCSNPSVRDTIGEISARRYSRRSMIKTAAGAAAGFCWAGARLESAILDVNGSSSTLGFEELEHGLDEQSHVAPGYRTQVLARWGDPVMSAAPEFDPWQQSGARQARQFGYNCDFIAFLPLPRGSQNSTRGLLCVNHEYTNSNLMFPGITDVQALRNMPRELVEVELAAHGHSVLEVARQGNLWSLVRNSRFNRRITTSGTTIRVSGPAAGHERLKTSADPTGKRVLGTFNNCAGGVTPWGTMLICEENFNNGFSGDPEKTPEAENHKRYGILGPSRFSSAWAAHEERFHIEREPNEPNRFGWVVEFDPYDPQSVPVKRTALGRFKHEGAGIVVNHDGRIVVYCGDDERFDYVYRFVSRDAFQPDDPHANRDLLDHGTLCAARYLDDGRLRWLPLVHGLGPLTSENGFHSQADVVIETRRAADLMGATPMDRPEDVEPSPTSGHIFVILTNNSDRSLDRVDRANPRADNHYGHILEMIPPVRAGEMDHSATEFTWEMFLRAGNPRDPEHAADCHREVTENGWFTCPDNSTFDNQGRMWLTTDSDVSRTGFADGVYACDTEGPGRALTKLFFRGPRGSEVSGVCLTPDNSTLFVSVQHPGEEPDSDFQKPSTRWPDFRADRPPRPSVVAITHQDGQIIGDF